MKKAEILQRFHGLYGIADAEVARFGDPVRLARQLLDGGCRLLQFRAKKLSKDEIRISGTEILAECQRYGAVLILNDHAEIAASIGAHGVHLGQLDGTVAAAREIVGKESVIGRSTNHVLQLREAVAEADYVAFGPVFPTANAGRPKRVRGLVGLNEARGFVPAHRPLVAIGGITETNLFSVVAAGADSWAVIGAIANAPDPIAATKRLLKG